MSKPVADLASRGFAMPAEWEKHDATWLSYPHNPDTFFEKIGEVRDAYVEIIRNIAAGETVHVNVTGVEMEDDLRWRLAKKGVAGDIRIHRFPTNDSWCRDHGAIIVRNRTGGERLALNWRFNSWGGKYPHDLDEQIPGKMADYLGFPRIETGLVLEGGSIEVNGRGVMLTTEQCLLNPNRNPQLSKDEIESALMKSFGIGKILWLGEGVAGDDTDGHIDDIARFVNENTIVTVFEENEHDVNHEPLRENLERLKSCTDIDGRPFTIHTLPMPDPVIYKGERMPASYANFYLCNAAVLVPVFNCASDAVALEKIGAFFPDRKVVGIDCTDIVIGLGTIHCLTQQIPAA